MAYKEIVKENEEEESIFPGELVNFVEGETREGYYSETEEISESLLHHFNKHDEETHWKVWGSKLLDEKMKDAVIGLKTLVKFDGKRKNKTNNRSTKFWTVMQDEDDKLGGEASASSSSSNEPETLDLSGQNSDEQAVNDIVNEQVNQNQNKDDWYTKIQEYLPEKPEDYENPEKRAASWIQGIRQDIIGTGVHESKVTPKTIRDNTAILVEDGVTEDHDLGKLDEEAGREIFKLLRKVEPA